MTQLVEIVEMLRSRPSVSASEMVDHIYGDDPEGGPLTALTATRLRNRDEARLERPELSLGEGTMIIDHPPCEFCRQPMFQRVDEAGWHYRRRKCCNTKCSNRLKARHCRERPKAAAERVAIAETRSCIVCGGKMVFRAFEKVGNFENRRTCSPECTTQYRGIQASLAVRAKAVLEVTPRQTKPIDYGEGFGAHNIDPGDGGPIRLDKPLTHTAGGVGRYL